jgi:flagellar biogenesis protein FliO
MDVDFRQILSSSSKSPQKILKIVLGISGILLIIWLLLVFRMDVGSQDHLTEGVSQEQVESVESLREGMPSSVKEDRSSSIFMNAFTTFLVLVSILGGIWLWSRKSTPAKLDNELVEIAHHMLGQEAQLKIIEINNEVWVLGVTSRSVELLHRYPKQEWTGGPASKEAEQRSFNHFFNGNT